MWVNAKSCPHPFNTIQACIKVHPFFTSFLAHRQVRPTLVEASRDHSADSLVLNAWTKVWETTAIDLGRKHICVCMYRERWGFSLLYVVCCRCGMRAEIIIHSITLFLLHVFLSAPSILSYLFPHKPSNISVLL